MSQSKDYHEQRLRAAIYRRTHAEPGSVNDRIPPEFLSCSEDGKKCNFHKGGKNAYEYDK